MMQGHMNLKLIVGFRKFCENA